MASDFPASDNRSAATERRSWVWAKLSGHSEWRTGNLEAARWLRRRLSWPTGYPLRWVPLPWRWRLWLADHGYKLGTRAAERVCRGNRCGVHTPGYAARRQLGGPCLCERVRRRLDYIPF